MKVDPRSNWVEWDKAGKVVRQGVYPAQRRGDRVVIDDPWANGSPPAEEIEAARARIMTSLPPKVRRGVRAEQRALDL